PRIQVVLVGRLRDDVVVGVPRFDRVEAVDVDFDAGQGAVAGDRREEGARTVVAGIGAHLRRVRRRQRGGGQQQGAEAGAAAIAFAAFASEAVVRAAVDVTPFLGATKPKPI